MNRFTVTLLTGAVAALLLGSSSARADNLPWRYNWTPSTLTVNSTTSATTKLRLTNEPLDADGNPLSNVTVSGNSDIVATAISVESDAPSGFPDEWKTSDNLVLKLKITDGTSNQTASFLFTGHFNSLPGEPSTASAENSNVKFTLLSPTSYTQVLGNAEYTISYNSYTPPPPVGAANKGAISFHVSVRGVEIQKAPEPTSMLLAGIGASFMGLGALRKRRRQAAAIETA